RQVVSRRVGLALERYQYRDARRWRQPNSVGEDGPWARRRRGEHRGGLRRSARHGTSPGRALSPRAAYGVNRLTWPSAAKFGPLITVALGGKTDRSPVALGRMGLHGDGFQVALRSAYTRR